MNTQENQGNFIIRCPECILIPSIQMKFESNEIEYECENKHKNTLSYDKFISESKKYSLDNIQCLNCKNKKTDDIKYHYCFQCNNFICLKCLDGHNKNNKNHIYIQMELYDGCCKEHNNSYSNYCKDFKKIYAQFALIII